MNTTKTKYRFLIGVISCVIIVFFAGVGFSVKDSTYENTDDVSQNLIAREPRIEAPKIYNTDEIPFEEEIETTEIPEELPDAESVFVPMQPERYLFPVNGEITAHYSETPVYSRTLGDWRSHNGIDISASEGEKVFAAAPGVVKDAYFDTFFGYTVVLTHTGGTETVYSNLSGDITVAPGQTVAEGELIAYAGSTASCESEEDPHIHFELKKEDKYLDPSQHLTRE